MYSSHDTRCSHLMDFSIRKSPDHRMLASPRGLSQLATSFIAYLRQGIHTHALSSLTIKLTLDTYNRIQKSEAGSQNCTSGTNSEIPIKLLALHTVYWLHGVFCNW